ncbi:MAG: hypothetical protein U5N56_08040 [Candidatus Marinimicrobia bacterium]|nr:hypothetical protein [Candidatus Neomarinimicrobiota bacterium]
MDEYGVFLQNKDDNKRAGLIKIDPTGVLIVRGGDEQWNYGTYKVFMNKLERIVLPVPLNRKYSEELTSDKTLPKYAMVIEAWKIAEAINKNEVHILGHPVKALAVII